MERCSTAIGTGQESLVDAIVRLSLSKNPDDQIKLLKLCKLANLKIDTVELIIESAAYTQRDPIININELE